MLSTSAFFSIHGGGITILNVEDKVEVMIRLVAYQNEISKTFLESANEELSNEILEFFIQHLHDLLCSFRE